MQTATAHIQSAPTPALAMLRPMRAHPVSASAAAVAMWATSGWPPAEDGDEHLGGAPRAAGVVCPAEVALPRTAERSMSRSAAVLGKWAG